MAGVVVGTTILRNIDRRLLNNRWGRVAGQQGSRAEFFSFLFGEVTYEGGREDRTGQGEVHMVLNRTHFTLP